MSDQAIVFGGMLAIIFIFVGCIFVYDIVSEKKQKKEQRRKELNMYGKPKQ